jgi:hypothetical protein
VLIGLLHIRFRWTGHHPFRLSEFWSLPKLARHQPRRRSGIWADGNAYWTLPFMVDPRCPSSNCWRATALKRPGASDVASRSGCCSGMLGRPSITQESDASPRWQRFAVTLCWSEGDSNCRSSLSSVYSGKACDAGDFERGHLEKTRELFFDDSSHGLPKRADFETVSQERKTQSDRRFESPPPKS